MQINRASLIEIHSALDAALGDTDVSHIEGDDELRDAAPVQWAAMKLAEMLNMEERTKAVTDEDRRLARDAIVAGWSTCNRLHTGDRKCDCDMGAIDDCTAKIEAIAKAIAEARGPTRRPLPSPAPDAATPSQQPPG